MGVCLYLALIRQLLHDDFRLAVLDDVVTSVDTNHRRQFCSLLKDVFPDVQFILTTHDESLGQANAVLRAYRGEGPRPIPRLDRRSRSGVWPGRGSLDAD